MKNSFTTQTFEEPLKSLVINDPHGSALAIGIVGIVSPIVTPIVAVSIAAVAVTAITCEISYACSRAISLNQQISKRGSICRIAWLQQINALEKKRLRETKVMLEVHCMTLIKACEDEAKKGKFPTNNLKEIEQLSQIFQAIF